MISDGSGFGDYISYGVLRTFPASLFLFFFKVSVDSKGDALSE
jgi:hypothetical protein